MSNKATLYSPYSVERARERPGSSRASAGRAAADVISLICEHHFEVEILAKTLAADFPDAEIQTFGSTLEWERSRNQASGRETVLYNIGDRKVSEDATKAELKQFIQKAGERRVIIISRDDDHMAVFDAIECGAASYIPSTVGIDDLVEAMRMSSTRSVVIPRQSMSALRRAIPAKSGENSGLDRYFTDRQLAVAKSLRLGNANKAIAYELGLCESTVKVHIRTIMQRLRATNRTQAAFRLNELANGNTSIEIARDG